MIYLGSIRQAKILAVFLLIAVSVSGQTGKSFKYHFNGDLQQKNVIAGDHSIIINYSLSELAIDTLITGSGPFYRLAIPGHTVTADPGKPELPVLNRLISVPEGVTYMITVSDVKSSKIRPSKSKIKGVVFPSQPGETKQDQKLKSVFVIDRKSYSRHDFINPDTVRIEPLGKIRGKEFSNLIISPVRYNPGSNLLEIITSMKIEITFSGNISSASKSQTESALFNETFDKGTLNYFPGDLITGYSDQPVGMVILTDTTFKKYLEPFYKWKRQKGFKLDILYRGADNTGVTYSEIKESISKIYSANASQGHAPEYLLIIGDAAKIPYYGSDNVTDMYYGEFDGNGDYLPDMYIGRIPAGDTSSVKSVVQKILEYEKFQFADTNKFYSKALAFAGKDASYASYMNGQIKYAINNYLTPANKINEFHFYYPDGFTEKDSIIKLISNGLSFINYTGHGSSAGWLHVDIKSPDVRKLTNKSMYPFIISNACRTAQFNDTASFGSKLVLSADKGAIGFIGCTNDSYWDEDYVWAVGPGTPSADPQYTQTGLGAYDRLFHTHGELPSDWYITMGQVNFAGNMAVSSSSSLKKKYYWETYAVLGDPSIIPIIGKPSPFNISLPDTLPNGIRSLSVTSDPYSYMAVSHFDALWDASFASPSGSVVLDMPGISNDSCLVVVTGQNKIPLIKTVYFSDFSKEFINLSASGINDSEGNNNGKADFGETFYLRLKISNLGLSASSDLSATISSTSPWVTINNSSAFIGAIAGKSEKIIENELRLTIDDNIPDLGIVTIDLTLKDSRIEKKYKIDITIHAPVLEIINCLVDDSEFGNKNFIAEPGENFNLIFQVRNHGSSSTSGQLLIESQQDELEIVDLNIKSGVLQFGEISSIPVAAKLSSSAKYGDYVTLMSTLDCSPYIVNKDFSFRVGRIRESFESSSFHVFPWINPSARPWIISATNSVDGNLSARSGSISHSSSSILMIRTYFPEPDSLKFFYKVSSEPSYDYLQFKLNDTEMLKKSGETNWEKLTVAVPAGYNKLEWIYRKDNSVSQGADAAWVDLIDFAAKTVVKYIQKDLEVAEIISPVQKEFYGQEPVSVKVRNLGSDTLRGFSLAYSVNEKMPVIQSFNTILASYNDSAIVTFDKHADLDLSGTYDITVFGYENLDDYLPNDTLRLKVENTEIEESVNIFPNPFNDKLYIILNSKVNRNVKLSMINISGRKVHSENVALTGGENELFIDTSNLSPAVYILNISGDGISKAYKLIKLKQ